MKKMFSSKRIVFFLLFILFVFILLLWYVQRKTYSENMENIADKEEPETIDDAPSTEDIPKKNPDNELWEAYKPTLIQHEKERHFPYRYLYDQDHNILPIVLVSGFFRSVNEVNMYHEYVKNGIKVVGITAYKSFPKQITDNTGDGYKQDFTFDYYANIKNWLCCFRDPHLYGFDERHNLIDISESDFYDADESEDTTEKKYDMIYVCFKDSDECPMDGWNAVNRNYRLALECLPIIMNEFNLKMLIIGRLNCGLEKLYGDKLEILDFMPYHEFQEKLRQSRCLFIPNIYDASPRTVAEALIKDIPVVMNRSIVCGAKYINQETGELFTDENDLRYSLTKLLAKKDTISPKKWWKQNYNKKKMAKMFRDFLYKQYPETLENTTEIHFYM